MVKIPTAWPVAAIAAWNRYLDVPPHEISIGGRETYYVQFDQSPLLTFQQKPPVPCAGTYLLEEITATFGPGDLGRSLVYVNADNTGALWTQGNEAHILSSFGTCLKLHPMQVLKNPVWQVGHINLDNADILSAHVRIVVKRLSDKAEEKDSLDRRTR